MLSSYHVHSPTCECSAAQRKLGETDKRQRVVIVGAGFAGLSAAKALAKSGMRVTLIDQRNHHLFQPLLYQVATAALSPNQIATPIRSILRNQKNAEVLLGTVTGVDKAHRQVLLDGKPVNYDYLVLATGARHSYFGHDDWERVAPGLKSLEEALELRQRILLAFEKAELESDPTERQRLLTFVVIGAGPTGVEMAGAIAELAHRALARDFRSIDPKAARVILVEAGLRALPYFAEFASVYTEESLSCLGVEVLTNTRVTGIDISGVTVSRSGNSQFISSSCVVWAAGVAASPAASWLGITPDRIGRVPVGPRLTVLNHPEIFVIGDCASVAGKDGNPLPGLAPVAKQQGEYVGRVLKYESRGAAVPMARFCYRDYGIMATIGRKVAVAQMGSVTLRGLMGWLTWSLVHIYFLIGTKRRLSVASDWLWSFLTFERGARLITGSVRRPSHPEEKQQAA